MRPADAAAARWPQPVPAGSPRPVPAVDGHGRLAAVAGVLALVMLAIVGQLARLAIVSVGDIRSSMAEPIARTHARPDIVDRRGRLIATDVSAPSLFADPALILDVDEVVERLVATLPGLEEAELRRSLADRRRRFAWIKRRLAPIEAQRVHDLGLPGLAFRQEPKRVYPGGTLAGHVVGHVDAAGLGTSGIERYIDDTLGVEAVTGASPPRLGPVRLSLDLGVQHAVTEELKAAMQRYAAKAAAGLVMDVASGEIVAAVSLPSVDPHRPADQLDAERADRLQAGVFELGSIFKAFTVAMALEEGIATLDKVYDVTRPLEIGRYRITDLHPQRNPLTVRDIFLHSSNVGAGLMALEAGDVRQKAFLARIGLIEPMRTEAGPVTPPLLPKRWDRIETVTIGYGHGLAVAPVQVAAAASILVNGGLRVAPTFLARSTPPERSRAIAARTSDALREIMRLNVTAPQGTGRRAEVAAYRPGGKTGTAEMAAPGGYRAKSVIASFLGALPMDRPRYVTLVTLFEPQPGEGTGGHITAGVNAAPVTGRILERIAPLLGVLPRRLDGVGRPVFDAGRDAD